MVLLPLGPPGLSRPRGAGSRPRGDWFRRHRENPSSLQVKALVAHRKGNDERSNVEQTVAVTIQPWGLINKKPPLGTVEKRRWRRFEQTPDPLIRSQIALNSA